MATTNPFNFGQAAKLLANKYGPAATTSSSVTTVPSQPANQPSPTSMMGQAANNVQATVTPQATYKSPQVETLDKMNTFINNNSNFQFKQPDAFSYDQTSDPAYLSQLAEAKRNAQDQQANTNAALRATGQGKSSYSETVANQIGNKAMTSLADTLVPQLMQQAYQRYNDNANRDLQVQTLNYGTQQDAVSNYSNLYGLQDKEYFQNPVTEAGLTGNYLPEEAKQAIAGINALKKQAETKGITADDRSGLSMQADELRATLQRLGIDPSFYGADKTSAQASQNNPGIRTLGGQAQDLANKNANLNAAATYMDATGKVVTPQSDWSGYARQAANSSTPTLAGQGQAYNQNMDTRKQNFIEKQQGVDNTFRDSLQAYQVGRDSADDTYRNAQQKLSEKVQLGGLSIDKANVLLNQAQALGYVTPELAAVTGMPEGQKFASNESNNFAQLMEVWKATGKAPDGISGVAKDTVYGGVESKQAMTAESYATGYIDKAAQYDQESGMLMNMDPIEDMILESGLPYEEMKKLFVRYGIPLPSGG